jgi:hypothetical protein
MNLVRAVATNREPQRLTRRLAVAGGFALAMAPPALAHRSQSVLSTVSWNAGKSTLEVTHRLHAHDAEVGLALSTGVKAIDITQVRNQAQLMLYVEKRFSLSDGVATIALSPLDAEIQAEVILLHQEAKRAAPPTELVIEDQILCDVFDGQTNLVNVKLAQRTRTLIFIAKDGPKRAKDLL